MRGRGEEGGDGERAWKGGEGSCPLCVFQTHIPDYYFIRLHVYFNLDRDIYMVIYEHVDGRLCVSTSIEATLVCPLQR